MASPCSECRAKLEIPLACGDCGVLLDVPSGPGAVQPTPFELLALETSMEVDEALAKQRFRRYTRLVHPDFYATAGEEQRERAEAHNARLNAAYKLVLDDIARADWIVQHLDGPTEKELGAMPQAFLMEVMEWNETLEDNAPGSQCLANLTEELREHREGLMGSVKAALTPLPEAGAAELQDVRKLLNALRYVDRALARSTGAAAAH